MSSGLPTEYLLLNGHLQEMNWYKERYRAWFVGDYVLGDGGLYLSTPIDPLFLALPLLKASRKEVNSFSSPSIWMSRSFCSSISIIGSWSARTLNQLCRVFSQSTLQDRG